MKYSKYPNDPRIKRKTSSVNKSKKYIKAEPDIFEIVKNRKRDIMAREATVVNREKHERERREEHERKMATDIIYRESVVARNLDEKFTRRARNLRARLSKIKTATNNSFRCFSCKEVKTHHRSWVIKNDLVICRSCFFVYGAEGKGRMSHIDFSEIKLYSATEKKFHLDAADLCRLRSKTGSVQYFADLVGWTASFQYKLENGQTQFIREETMRDLIEAFAKCHILLRKERWGGAVLRYVPNGKIIKQIREARQLSIKELAIRAGWSASYQSQIESNTLSAKTVKKQTIDILYNLLNEIA